MTDAEAISRAFDEWIASVGNLSRPSERPIAERAFHDGWQAAFDAIREARTPEAATIVERDALQQQVSELLATPRALRVVCPNCREATPPIAATKSFAPFPLRALRVGDGIVR